MGSSSVIGKEEGRGSRKEEEGREREGGEDEERNCRRAGKDTTFGGDATIKAFKRDATE